MYNWSNPRHPLFEKCSKARGGEESGFCTKSHLSLQSRCAYSTVVHRTGRSDRHVCLSALRCQMLLISVKSYLNEDINVLQSIWEVFNEEYQHKSFMQRQHKKKCGPRRATSMMCDLSEVWRPILFEQNQLPRFIDFVLDWKYSAGKQHK